MAIRTSSRKRAGFTLLEVILVVVLIAIISGISAPYFANSLSGTKLKTSARSIERLGRYTRSMAIMRNETLMLVIDENTMELFMGGPAAQSTTNAADGQIDQDVLQRLGYVDGDTESPGIEKGFRRYLPEGLSINDFEKDWNEEDQEYENCCLVRFYSNGQCEWFQLKLEDSRGNVIQLENDPVSGKIRSEFVQ